VIRPLRPRTSAVARAFHLALPILIAATPLALRGQAVRTFSLRADNDAFDFWMAPWNRPDDEYTSGVHVSYDGGDAPWWSRRVLGNLLPCTVQSTACRTSRFEIGQDIYTPFVPASGPAPATQRPDAGWLYMSQSAQSLATDRSDALTLTFGVTGPPSLAQLTQHMAHDVGPAFNRPTDWSRQIAFEPGVIARFEHDARFATPSDEPIGIELVPRAGASLGNVLTAADAGARVRFGWHMSHPWLPPADDVGFDVLCGVSARAVARDLFLDGNTFENGPRVGHEPFVESGEAGFELHVRGIALGYRAVSDSRAYRAGPKWHPWGSLVGSVTLR
jgi:lipid A 3-O-deacylase